MPHNKVIIAFVLTCSAALLVSERTTAYVMPAEQILYLTGANFSNFKSLVITQSTRIKSIQNQDNDLTLTERIWLKAPDLYYSEWMNPAENQNGMLYAFTGRAPGGDMTFRRLFMANTLSERMSLVSDMGIDMESVSLTRFEGIVAYRLGDAYPNRAKLLIEKDTFLPIFLCYGLRKNSRRQTVQVRFKNYEEIQEGWYPHEIEYTVDDGSSERHTISELMVNTVIDQPLSEMVVERPIPFEETADPSDTYEAQRLREIIDLLKEKYD